MTKLGSALAGSPTPSVASRLLAALAGKRVREPITIPFLGISAFMTLIGTEMVINVEGEVAAAMLRRGLDPSVINQSAWQLERTLRLLSIAIVDEDDSLLGTPAEWGKLHPDAITELWRMYSDLSELHDPATIELDAETVEEIRIALVKKNDTALRRFGARRLSLYLLTTVDPLASSSTPKSSPGDSSPES